MAQWITRLTTNQKTADSIPARIDNVSFSFTKFLQVILQIYIVPVQVCYVNLHLIGGNRFSGEFS